MLQSVGIDKGALVAQSVERMTCNHAVGGSIPS